MPAKQFPRLLKRERQRRGWSQQYVADALKTTRVTITRWELGIAFPALYLRGPLCELFGKRVEEFFQLDGEELPLVRTNISAANRTQASSMPAASVIPADDPFERTGLKEGPLTHEAKQDVHNGERGDWDVSTDREIRKLDAEKRHMEIQLRRLEMQRTRVASTIEIANRMIDVLDPACDSAVRSLAIERLLTGLQQLGGESEQEIPLPTFQSVRKALEETRQEKAQTKNRQRKRRASPREDDIKVHRAEIPSLDEDLLVPDLGIAVDHPQMTSYVPGFPDERDNIVEHPSTGTAINLGPNNPYGRLTPILDPQDFVGRVQLRRRLFSALANRQSVSLVGPRRIGKSSVLHYLSNAEAQAGYAFDLRSHIFMLKDVGELIRKSKEDFFNGISAELILQSRDRLMLEMPKEAGEDGLSKLLIQIGNQGFFPVILLDEFDKIKQYPQFDPEFFLILRMLATTGRVSYVTASQAPLDEITPSSIATSPFFNIFNNYVLGPLTLEEARELITVPAEKAGLPFTEDETVWALEKAGRHPFFIQRVCHYFFEEKLLQGKSEIGEHRVLELAYYDLRSHFQNTWENLSEEQHEILQDEAQQRENHNRRLPELSESALFRQFVRHTCQTKVFKMTADELEHALEIRDNAEALGRTELRLMNLVSQRLSKDVLPSVAEKGTTVRAVLDEAFERLRGQAVRNDSDPALQGYNILYYRYFKYHLKHDQIAARIGTSARQYFRSRTRAIEALLNVLWEMENASSKEE